MIIRTCWVEDEMVDSCPKENCDWPDFREVPGVRPVATPKTISVVCNFVSNYYKKRYSAIRHKCSEVFS